jgi:hypothetical protein
MSVEYKTHAVNDVVTDVERQFGDESGVQVTPADIIRWINKGQREIANENYTINATKASTDVIQGQDTYPLRTDPNLTNILKIRSVRYNGQAMQNITFEEAENFVINTATTPPAYGIPTVWWEDAGDLHLYPIPTDGLVGGLMIHFTTIPKSVSSVGDLLDIPDEYYNALLQYVLQQAYELDENFQASQVKQSQFEKSMGILSSRTTAQDNTFPTITLDPEDSW